MNSIRLIFLALLLLSSTALAMPKGTIGFGATSLDLITVAGTQVGQGGAFMRLPQVAMQYDFGISLVNAGSNSAVFGSNVYWLQNLDEQVMFKYGPGIWWSTLGGTTAFQLRGQVGVEYNPVYNIGIEGVIVPLGLGFGPSNTSFQFFGARLAMIFYY